MLVNLFRLILHAQTCKIFNSMITARQFISNPSEYFCKSLGAIVNHWKSIHSFQVISIVSSHWKVNHIDGFESKDQAVKTFFLLDCWTPYFTLIIGPFALTIISKVRLNSP